MNDPCAGRNPPRANVDPQEQQARTISFSMLDSIRRGLDCQPGDLSDHVLEPETEPASALLSALGKSALLTAAEC